MIKLYAIIIIVGILGGAAYGAKYYYDTTQNTIAQLRDNNAKLEVTELVDKFYKDLQDMEGNRWDTSSLLKRLQEYD